MSGSGAWVHQRRPSGLRSELFVLGLVVGVVVALGAAGAFVLLTLPPRCAGCPSSSPLALALVVGGASASCIAPSVGAILCTYTFSVNVTPLYAPTPSGSGPSAGSAPTPLDLTFELEDSSDFSIVQNLSSVSLVTPSGCAIGSWSPDPSTGTGGSWSPSGGCGAQTLSSPLTTGDRLILTPDPPYALSLSHRGVHLLAIATGGGFAGQVGGWIP
ncbi:MAG TPA: hypothetical protein VEY07_02745 [Thermoplasmata archaeon]|nr:hypothetical protein [Thermoplasmata archaeon]